MIGGDPRLAATRTRWRCSSTTTAVIRRKRDPEKASVHGVFIISEGWRMGWRERREPRMDIVGL